nr:hypothetical protein [Tanacetum cinerariifolium]
MENIMYFNNGAGPSSSVGTPLTQEEAKKWVLAHSISIRYEMLKEVRPVIETLAYNDKYRNLLDKIWADKVSLDGKIKPDEERVMLKVKGQMIKEKKDPGAFIFPITLEGLINENALADTRSDINTMPYRIYKQLGRDDIMKEDRNITMINYIEAEVTGRLVNFYTSGAYDHKVGSSRPKRFRHVETVEEALLPNVHHEFLEWSGCSLEAKSRYNIRTTGYKKIQKNDLWLLSMFEARHQNRKSRVLTKELVRTLSTLVHCRDLDMTTLRELIDSEDRLILDILVDDV